MVWMKNYVTLFFSTTHYLPHRNQEYLYLRCHRGTLSHLADVLPVAWFINELPPKIRSLVTLGLLRTVHFRSPTDLGYRSSLDSMVKESEKAGALRMNLINRFSYWRRTSCPLVVVSLWMSLGTPPSGVYRGVCRDIDSTPEYEAGAVDNVRNR